MLRVRGIEATSPAFRRALVAMAARLEADADSIAAVMSVESGLKPDAVNKATGATGLIQFMPSTAKALGTSTAALRAMSREEQLPIVERFFAPNRGKMPTPRDTYLAVFMPALVGSPPERVIFTAPSVGYEQNAGLDVDHDGQITAGDVGSVVERELDRARKLPPIDDGEGGEGDGGAPSPSSSKPPASGAGLLICLALFLVGVAVFAPEVPHAT